jgi:hypothetical protein
MFIDARVPVLFGSVEDARPDDALLIDGDAEAPAGHVVARLSGDGSAAHVAGCVCCVPRSAAGSALAGLFLARGRGEVAFFRRVMVVTGDRGAIMEAVAGDVLASGWFRLVGAV